MQESCLLKNNDDNNNQTNEFKNNNINNLNIDSLINSINAANIANNNDKQVKINSYNHIVDSNLKSEILNNINNITNTNNNEKNNNNYELLNTQNITSSIMTTNNAVEDSKNINESNEIFKSVYDLNNMNLNNMNNVNNPNTNVSNASNNSGSNSGSSRNSFIYNENLYYFYWINEENMFVENNNINYNIKRIDHFEKKNDFKFLLKFTKAGTYKLIIKIQYRLSRENLESDSITVCYKDEIEVKFQILGHDFVVGKHA